MITKGASFKYIKSKVLPANTVGAGQQQRDSTQLRRLESMIDTVFALVIVLMVFNLPDPDDTVASDLGSFIAFQVDALFITMLGIIVVLIYWFQSNLSLGNLNRTDGKHAAISLLQIFLVLVYLLFVSLGIEFGSDPLVLAAQSISAALVGFAAAAAWWYASYDRCLLTPEINDDEVAALRLRVLAEPLTALLTLALAFVSAVAWEIGWLAYPLIAALLRKAGLGISARPSSEPEATNNNSQEP
jgi:uncharacterized membrane protein